MKELSIEEKAKRYDEVMGRAKKELDACGSQDCDAARQLFRLFPKLKESEDEKIRKELLNAFQESEDSLYMVLTPHRRESFVTWLEKQGKHANFINKIQIGDKVTRNKDGVLVNLSQLNRVAKKDEKQGGQKPNYCHHEVDLSNCSEEYRKAYYDGWNNCNMQHSQCKSELDDVVKCLINGMKFYYEDNEEATWGTDKWSMPVKHIIEVLEKQGEHNPADKPKFRVGDTITDPTDSTFTFHINAIKDGKYIESDKDWVLIKEADSDYELVEQKSVWSEEDKRIMKALIDYFRWNPDSQLLNEFNNRKVSAWLEKQGEQPQGKSALEAAKEEKIDNANKAEPKFKVGDWICHTVYKKPLLIVEDLGEGDFRTEPKSIITAKEFREGVFRLWTIQDAKDGDVLANDHHILILRELGYSWAANGNPDSLYAYCGIKPNGNFELEQKGYCFCGTLHTHPATKEQRDTLMKAMTDAGYTFDFEKKELKKIEQPKLTKFDDAIKDMMDDYRDAIDDNAATVEEVKERAAYLLSLIPQKSAEWSEADERNASYICAALDCYNRLREDRNNTNGQEDLDKARNWLYNRLKSLRPQSHWKPSDEQLEALADALSLAKNCGEENAFDLRTLYEQLKKLMEE